MKIFFKDIDNIYYIFIINFLHKTYFSIFFFFNKILQRSLNFWEYGTFSLSYVKFYKQNSNVKARISNTNRLSRNCKSQSALSGDIKERSRVAFNGKAFQMTSQNASLREREQVSLRSGDGDGDGEPM